MPRHLFHFTPVTARAVLDRGGWRLERLPLRPQSVAEFYDELLSKLDELGLAVSIHGSPNELEDATPFADIDPDHPVSRAVTILFWEGGRSDAAVMKTVRAADAVCLCVSMGQSTLTAIDHAAKIANYAPNLLDSLDSAAAGDTGEAAAEAPAEEAPAAAPEPEPAAEEEPAKEEPSE